MAKTAFIIEDDDSGGKLLADLCTKLGVEFTLFKNGKEAFEKAKIAPPDLLLMDMLVPGLDGFKIAEGLKAANALPALVVVTGVYKDQKVQKEFQDKYQADFFYKPLKIDLITAAMQKKLGLVTAAPAAAQLGSPRRVTNETMAVKAMEGSLRSKPYVALLMELFRAKANGTLDLSSGQMKKRLFLNRGFIRYAQSNVKSENVGGMQVAEGKLTEEQFAAAVQRAKTEGIPIAEALSVSGALPYDVVAAATKRQVEEVSLTPYTWLDGTYKFIPGSTDSVQEVRQNPLTILLTAFKRYVTPEQARQRLQVLGKGTAGRSPEFDRELSTMRAVFPGEVVTPLVNGRLAIAEILVKAKPAELPLLLGLLETAVATLAGVELQKTAAATVVDPGRPFTAQEEASRALIAAEHVRVSKAADLYLVLRQARTATTDELKAAYLPLAKKFHADAYSAQLLGDAEPKLKDVFARISEANATLCDPKKRAEYDVLLERIDKGLPTDMEVIFKAEAAANRADALTKQGRFTDAEAALKEALKLDGSVAHYHAALGYTILRGRGAAAAAEARAACDKALALQPEFHAAKITKAMALEQEGEAAKGQSLLREVLAVQPDNVDAARELRNMRERYKSKDENKGLLGKIFKR